MTNGFKGYEAKSLHFTSLFSPATFASDVPSFALHTRRVGFCHNSLDIVGSVLRSLYLPLDEAIASTAVFVIISGSDGRAETVWSKLNKSKTVWDRPYVSTGANRNPWAGYWIDLSLTPHVSLNPGWKLSLSNCSQMVGDVRKCQ